MPLYEYRCSTCGHRFEVLQRLGEGASSLVCPACDAPEVEKQLSTFAASSAGSPSASVAASPACGAGSGFT